MDTVITTLLLLIAAETTYLTAAHLKPSKTKIESKSILLDTSVLIDGRIESIALSGLISAPLVVPRSVVRELQYMADKADHDKRERARFGLDMIEKLQGIDLVSVIVVEDGPLDDGGVDERLVSIAKESDARLCTTDYNLNKAARVQGVTVLNINEIAHALRIVHLPGEHASVVLVQAGQERDQAVGYLDDGTMVVVDNGKSLIGGPVTVEVTRALQTAAGKMLFAKLLNAPQQARASKRVDTRTPATAKPKVLRTSLSQPRPVAAPKEEQESAPQPQQPRPPRAPREPQETRTPKPGPKHRRRKSMTDKAEDSLVDLLNKQ